ncbi:MAG: cysteine hydrolase [Alphaproteobacteria bacterium]|nr:cysteine hydrolase [Alphaproteobacteria bacterium]
MHKIDIPQSVMEACKRRRGSSSVYDHLDPAKTALVVIDMQNSWLEPGLSVLEIPEARSIIPNINTLANKVRSVGGTVAWTQSTFAEPWTSAMYKGFCDEKWIRKIIAESAPGTHGFGICDRMDWHEDDITVTKNRPSALIQGASDLEARLRDRGCDTIIITGTLTNACCESTARDAAALGFHVVFASDGTATRSDIEHNATLINLMQLVADVRPTNEIMDMLS